MDGWTRRMGWLAMLVAGCAGEGARGRAPMAVSAPAAPPPGAAAPDATAASTAAPDASRGAAAAGAAAPDAAAPPPDPRKPTLELAFAGDVMFGRYVETGFREIPAIDHDPFAAVAQLLDSDFTLVNLEAPILRQRPARSPHGTRMKFVATPAQVARLVGANVDGVTLANNHAWDMRLPGVRQTPAVLDELGLRYVGAYRDAPPLVRPETLEVAGWRIGVVAVTAIRNQPARRRGPQLPYAAWDEVEAAVLPAVRAARAAHDLVLVVPHWGEEYADVPARWQVAAARAWIDAGADAVVGHHAHVLQGIERYGAGVIAYSLGNFLFDNVHRRKRLGGVLRLAFARDGRCLAQARFHPTVGTRPRYAPVPAGKEFSKVAGRLQRLSVAAPLRRTAWTVEGESLVAAGACPPP